MGYHRSSSSRSAHMTQPRLAYAALAGVVLLAYARVLWFPFIAFDDAVLILRNPQITRPLAAPIDLLMTPHVGYIVPVTIALKASLFAVSHGQPWSFHAASLVLHALFATQVCAFARQLGVRPTSAFLAALLFALHPLVVQPVAWAVCLKDLLMANLAFAATRMFVAAARDRDHVPRPRIAAAVVLAVLAMLSKPTAALLGLAWLAYSLAGSEPHAAARRGALVLTGIGGLLGLASRTTHDAFLGAETDPAWSLLTPLIVLGRQCLHVLWPANLLIAYAPPETDPARVPTALLGAAVVALLLWLGVRARKSPEVLLLLCIALGVYLPTSGLIPFGRVMSDSYVYVPLACLCIGAARAFDHHCPGPLAARTGLGLALALAAALATSGALQLPRWQGGAALWGPVVRTYPQFAMAHRLFADELVFRGEPARAVAPYQRAFALDYDPRFLLEFGTTLSMAGRIPEAECVLIEAIAYGNDPGYALFNFAALLAFHPDYAPEHTALAKQLLRRFERMRSSQQLQFPPGLEPGLARQIARLGPAAAQDAPWPRRNCAVLRAATTT
ncbi:MAG TPA: hypothetical protein VJV78_30280 [Polyangiales bacterium]|nr:hypothetical protein [Polyangiales bacterium]